MRLGAMRAALSGVGLWFLCGLLACQPQTKRDRAGVGPEVAQNSADDAIQATPDDTLDSASSAADRVEINPKDWRESLRRLCDDGVPFACSQLGYDAQRAEQWDEAIGLLTRACLLDVPVAQCAQAEKAAQGLARACADLAPLYLQKGRAQEAQVYKKCACDRSFQLACL
jgi:hypothetical protein